MDEDILELLGGAGLRAFLGQTSSDEATSSNDDNNTTFVTVSNEEIEAQANQIDQLINEIDRDISTKFAQFRHHERRRQQSSPQLEEEQPRPSMANLRECAAVVRDIQKMRQFIQQTLRDK